MKKINIVKSNEDFSKIINACLPIKHRDFSIYLIKTENQPYRFGISVGKKLGNAVLRNKIKRQVKDIIDEKKYQNNFDCIIMIKKASVVDNFLELKNNLLEAFNRVGIIKGDSNE